jgi:hypothetical protein
LSYQLLQQLSAILLEEPFSQFLSPTMLVLASEEDYEDSHKYKCQATTNPYTNA